DHQHLIRNLTMSYDFDPPSRWRRLKRAAIVGGIVGFGCLFVFLALWNTFFVYVKPGTHLVIIAKRGKPLGPNQVLADEGQEGVQRRVYGEGWHFVWPIIYDTERHPNTVILPGEIGIVTAKGGEPLRPGQGLAEEGQQGIQRHVLLPGEYR